MKLIPSSGIQVFGHRGSMATHPENTLPGFLHAIACGADGVELDVAATADDVLVVTHDLISPKTGRAVRAERASDLDLPALDDVLALASPANFWFDVEAKAAPGMAPDPEQFAQLLGAVFRRSRAAGRILVRSFDHHILRAFGAIEPNVPRSALIDYDSDSWPQIARAADASAISPHHTTVNESRVSQAHAAQIRVSAWTANHPDEWLRLARCGVDAIVTDDPAAAVRYFRYLFRSG